MDAYLHPAHIKAGAIYGAAVQALQAKSNMSTAEAHEALKVYAPHVASGLVAHTPELIAEIVAEYQ